MLLLLFLLLLMVVAGAAAVVAGPVTVLTAVVGVGADAVVEAIRAGGRRPAIARGQVVGVTHLRHRVT